MSRLVKSHSASHLNNTDSCVDLNQQVTHSVITLQHDSVLQLNEQVSQHTFSHHTKRSLLHTACHTHERGAYYKVLPRSQDTFCHHNLQHDIVLQSRVDLNQQDTFIITFIITFTACHRSRPLGPRTPRWGTRPLGARGGSLPLQCRRD